jgi:hypothetical protein
MGLGSDDDSEIDDGINLHHPSYYLAERSITIHKYNRQLVELFRTEFLQVNNSSDFTLLLAWRVISGVYTKHDFKSKSVQPQKNKIRWLLDALSANIESLDDRLEGLSTHTTDEIRLLPLPASEQEHLIELFKVYMRRGFDGQYLLFFYHLERQYEHPNFAKLYQSLRYKLNGQDPSWVLLDWVKDLKKLLSSGKTCLSVAGWEEPQTWIDRRNYERREKVIRIFESELQGAAAHDFQTEQTWRIVSHVYHQLSEEERLAHVEGSPALAETLQKMIQERDFELENTWAEDDCALLLRDFQPQLLRPQAHGIIKRLLLEGYEVDYLQRTLRLFATIRQDPTTALLDFEEYVRGWDPLTSLLSWAVPTLVELRHGDRNSDDGHKGDDVPLDGPLRSPRVTPVQPASPSMGPRRKVRFLLSPEQDPIEPSSSIPGLDPTPSVSNGDVRKKILSRFSADLKALTHRGWPALLTWRYISSAFYARKYNRPCLKTGEILTLSNDPETVGDILTAWRMCVHRIILPVEELDWFETEGCQRRFQEVVDSAMLSGLDYYQIIDQWHYIRDKPHPSQHYKVTALDSWSLGEEPVRTLCQWVGRLGMNFTGPQYEFDADSELLPEPSLDEILNPILATSPVVIGSSEEDSPEETDEELDLTADDGYNLMSRDAREVLDATEDMEEQAQHDDSLDDDELDETIELPSTSNLAIRRPSSLPRSLPDSTTPRHPQPSPPTPRTPRTNPHPLSSPTRPTPVRITPRKHTRGHHHHSTPPRRTAPLRYTNHLRTPRRLPDTPTQSHQPGSPRWRRRLRREPPPCGECGRAFRVAKRRETLLLS